MKLSLREARKLETRIQAKIRQGIVQGRAINIHEGFLDNTDLTEGWLAETFAMGDESVASVIGLTEARTLIRRLVQQTNEEVGINELISQRTGLISLRSIYQDVVDNYDVANGHAMTADVLQRVTASAAEAAKTSSASSSMYGRGRTDTITVSTISDETNEVAEGKVRSLLRDIDKVEDKLAALNASTTIELPSTMVDFLESEDLV